MTTQKTTDTTALATTLQAAIPDLRRLAPRYVKIERLMALALEAKLRNPLLANTSLESVILFCKRCAEWGTDRVGAGGAWPVPFWNKKTSSYDMVAIPDWRLLIEKAKRAGAISHATADIVRDGDQFTFSRGMHPDLFHSPKIDNPGAIIAAYCVYTLPDGSRDFTVMGWQEIEAIRNRSNAWKGYLKDKARTCPWNTDEAEMAKKTIVKRAMKLFEGASIELTSILEADHALLGSEAFEPPAPIAMPKLVEMQALLTAAVAVSDLAESAATDAPNTPSAPAEMGQTPFPPPVTQPTVSPPPPKGDPSLDTRTISEPQQKRLFAIMKSAGVEQDLLHDHLAEQYQLEHTKEIQRHQYEAICNWVESQGRQHGDSAQS